ncbi:hypothetical protein QBC34DRAFT_223278 [Podospora aff. communis PSN243]|uniref:Uncharacterized protein n=1 Tax=Podospora aff. communis PSN243 TaxID=3040156 RepID=A0AAV9G2F7_9PEZI|nr:hypothetical protein QBC34DRAFT_223278 [Podospora aff. communis PSN243]
MSLAKLQAALGMVTNEVTIAAANINFDFTLVKNEAPREYHALGESLSKKRRDDAESGQPHITARRLGALFDGICPPTANLQRVYGMRVSEICRVTKQDAISCSPSEGSAFAQYVGVDGTSIWAAATSSPSAIQVQLLACMLARMFDASEATSVWVELVKDRRAEIGARFQNNEEVHFSVLTAAAQAEISRAQLAEWDASARAWLRTADAVKMKQQKQLMLILDNLDLYVNKDIRVYSSVLAAWKSSLTVMESLISGTPQAVEDGAAILGLSSWHIYPNMVVVGPRRSKDLAMNDDLVGPGGTLTVGIQSHPATAGQNRGIYWSLSLAHLRFYGQPVLQTRELSSHSCRVTFNQLSIAALGALFSQWGLPLSRIHSGIDITIAISEALKRSIARRLPADHEKWARRVLRSPHWFYIISEAARHVSLSKAQERDEALKLVKLGYRRGGMLAQLPTDDSNPFEVVVPSPFFGLAYPVDFLKSLESTEDRLQYLRKVALKMCQHLPQIVAKDVFIRTKSDGGEVAYNLATALPGTNPFAQHERWLTRSRKVKGREIRVVYRPSPRNGDTGSPPRTRYVNEEVVATNDALGGDVGNLDGDLVQDISGEICHELSDESSPFQHENDFFLRVRKSTSTSRVSTVRYNFVFGIQRLAGIFIRSGKEPDRDHIPNEVEAEDMLCFLNEDALSVHPRRASLLTMIDQATTKSLLALSLSFLIFQKMTNATLDIRVLDQPIVSTKWAQFVLSSETGWNRESALACLAYYETGNQDVPPSQLKDVFAMSVGDSIYIPEQLLCDPWEESSSHTFRKILGNVGRSGVTMLIPPIAPMIRSHDPSSWRVIQNSLFDHADEDHFGSTTLHLKFTEYCRPLDLNRSQQDVQVELLESYISVHEAGKWVADVDIFRALGSVRVSRLPAGSLDVAHHHTSCGKQGCEEKVGGSARNTPIQDIVSLDNWDAILDLPSDVSIVRARGNSMARLAIAAVLIQLQQDKNRTGGCGERQVLVLPPTGDICVKCLGKQGQLGAGKVLIH